jgi:hypothetical protein
MLASGHILHMMDHKEGIVDRDCQSDADISCFLAGRINGRIDPDYLTLPIEQRPARVALVDRRIRLDEIVERRELLVPIECTYDAGCYRSFVAERISNGDWEIAFAKFLTVADPHRVPNPVRRILSTAISKANASATRLAGTSRPSCSVTV